MKCFSFSSLIWALPLVVGDPIDFKHLVPAHPPSSNLQAPVWHAPTYTRNNRVIISYMAGGDHGADRYNDATMVGNDYKRIGRINMWCDKTYKGQLQALSFDYRNNFLGKTSALINGPIHGTNRNPAWLNSWTLDLNEFIRTMTVYSYKARGHTRIGTIMISTNKRTDLAICGPQSGDYVRWGGDGKALLYVEGSSGRIVDFMKGNFIDDDGF